MSCLQYALEVARAGFHVFPLRPGSKLPQIEKFPVLATTDPKKIEDWWYQWPQANVGISTSSFNGGEFTLVVADVDNKPQKPGLQTKCVWEMVEGREFPQTYTQHTPTGGQHLVYKTKVPCQGRADLEFKGSGIDSRGKGNYIVGANSTVEGGVYVGDLRVEVADAPQWLVDLCRYQEAPPKPVVAPPVLADIKPVVDQAREFLLRCPIATAGSRNDAAYKAASRVKDYGVPEAHCLELMATVWNVNALPPLSGQELAAVTHSAYEYGQNITGSCAPEQDFEPVMQSAIAPTAATNSLPMDVEGWNKEFAFAICGVNGNILWFTENEKDEPDTKFISTGVFHDLMAGKKVKIGSEVKPFSRLWMAHGRRRTYKGVVFVPGKAAPTDYFNLWRGYAVLPLAKGADPDAVSQAALDSFLEHIQMNVCQGRKDHAKWLLAFFAHLVQRPWEKPLVAIVLRGEKGVGKDTMVNIIGHILGPHFMNTPRKRHLVGNFNSHLEKLLLFCLNEAFWSHDKEVQGVLQDLITRDTHTIERKGQEPYDVANVMRLVIMGNEDSLVPASWDERRFFCLDVGSGWKQQTKRFESMRLGMEAGGYELLLRYLMEFDISSVDLNVAPRTAALRDQQHEQMEPFGQWWFECLQQGRIVNADFSDGWPLAIDKETIRSAIYRYYEQRKIRSRLPQMMGISKALKRCCPATITTNPRKSDAGEIVMQFLLPELGDARAAWDKFIGYEEEWAS